MTEFSKRVVRAFKAEWLSVARQWSFLRAVLLLALAVAFSVAGFLIRPTGSAAPVIPTVFVKVLTTRDDVQLRTVDLSNYPDPDHPDVWHLDFFAFARAPAGPPVQMAYVVMDVPAALPDSLLGWTEIHSNPAPCQSGGAPTDVINGTNLHCYLGTEMVMAKPDGSVDSLISFDLEFHKSVSVETQGSYVLIQTPQINLGVFPSDATYAATILSEPVTTTSVPVRFAVPYYQPAVADMDIYIETGRFGPVQLSPVAAVPAPSNHFSSVWVWLNVSGATMLLKDVAAEDRNTNQLFIAGLLFGLAGGAAIAFVQEIRLDN